MALDYIESYTGDLPNKKSKIPSLKKILDKIVSPKTRAKHPVLDKLILFSNYIVFAIAVLFLVIYVNTTLNGAVNFNLSDSSIENDSVRFTTASESDFTVRIASNGAAAITGYTGSGGNIIIPQNIQGMQVTEISQFAFMDKRNLTGIRLPEGLKVIGRSAFEGCLITTITIPDSVSVFGANIFQDSRLSRFTFPAGLIASKTIPASMFYRSALSDILVIPEGIETIEKYAFSLCSNLVTVILPSTIKSIDEYAFSECDQLVNIVIPSDVTVIRFNNLSFWLSPKIDFPSQNRLRQLGYTGSW